MRRRDSSNSNFYSILGHPIPFFQGKETGAKKGPVGGTSTSIWDPEHLPFSLGVFPPYFVTYSILYFCSALRLKIQSLHVCVCFFNVIYSLQIAVWWKWGKDLLFHR